jgi:hypothetical protein
VEVDVPTNWLGRLCAGSGQWLFRQPELDENVRGLPPTLFAEAVFATVTWAGHHLGYVTCFVLR